MLVIQRLLNMCASICAAAALMFRLPTVVSVFISDKAIQCASMQCQTCEDYDKVGRIYGTTLAAGQYYLKLRLKRIVQQCCLASTRGKLYR